jgi:hypothetical protein
LGDLIEVQGKDIDLPAVDRWECFDKLALRSKEILVLDRLRTAAHECDALGDEIAHPSPAALEPGERRFCGVELGESVVQVHPTSLSDERVLAGMMRLSMKSCAGSIPAASLSPCPKPDDSGLSEKPAF